MRSRAVVVGMVLTAVAAWDLWRAPSDQWSGRVAVAGIHAYQATLGPLYAKAGGQCRFTPTCSHYGEEAIRRHGFVRGGWLTATRIVRCGPWTPAGTADPPP